MDTLNSNLTSKKILILQILNKMSKNYDFK
jgi:hypothetical protein